MDERDLPQSQHSVAEVMCRWPATIPLFIRRRMRCVGCPVGSLHTISDAALEYELPIIAFLAELRDAAAPKI